METRWPGILQPFAQMENARLVVEANPLANLLLAAGLLDPADMKQWGGCLPGASLPRTPYRSVYELARRASNHMRSPLWARDFGINGEPRASRLPCGGPVLCLMFGIPFVAVYDSTYMLAGSLQN